MRAWKDDRGHNGRFPFLSRHGSSRRVQDDRQFFHDPLRRRRAALRRWSSTAIVADPSRKRSDPKHDEPPPRSNPRGQHEYREEIERPHSGRGLWRTRTRHSALGDVGRRRQRRPSSTRATPSYSAIRSSTSCLAARRSTLWGLFARFAGVRLLRETVVAIDPAARRVTTGATPSRRPPRGRARGGLRLASDAGWMRPMNSTCVEGREPATRHPAGFSPRGHVLIVGSCGAPYPNVRRRQADPRCCCTIT